MSDVWMEANIGQGPLDFTVELFKLKLRIRSVADSSGHPMLSQFVGPASGQKFPPTVGDGWRENEGPLLGLEDRRPNVGRRQVAGPLSALFKL